MNTFEADKTAKALGIDTTRRFVVVTGNDRFEKGDILKFFKIWRIYSPLDLGYFLVAWISSNKLPILK